MRVLIIGASGFLGKKLMNSLPQKFETFGTYHNEIRFRGKRGYLRLNALSYNDAKKKLNSIRPNVVVHLPAIPDPDTCETNKKLAWKLNVQTTKNVDRVCSELESKLIFTSTNYVFDGARNSAYTEDDMPNPINFYGLTKVCAEREVKKCQSYVIVRLPLLYGYNDRYDGSTFVTTVVKKLLRNEVIEADTKRIRYPTLIDDVEKAIVKLIEVDASGTFHLSGDHGLSKYELALLIAKEYDLPQENILGYTAKPIARRPTNVALDTSKAKRLGIKFSRPNEGLRTMKHQMVKNGFFN